MSKICGDFVLIPAGGPLHDRHSPQPGQTRKRRDPRRAEPERGPNRPRATAPTEEGEHSRITRRQHAPPRLQSQARKPRGQTSEAPHGGCPSAGQRPSATAPEEEAERTAIWPGGPGPAGAPFVLIPEKYLINRYT